ncbi:MAG TPA: tetratricopeptide repeat protein, partial [Candidatus Sulfotelmatobacter sp.]|nr:tetratricopeptide repeat protein [Candidatus Sulfotelmatobacter sp.]
LTAANMLGLAEIRLEAGDVDGAMALLRRMTLVVGNPFENHDAAAALLVRTGHPVQAISFLEELVKAVPWNAQYRGRLAQVQLAANQNVEAARKELAAIVSDKFIAYGDRASFADGLQSVTTGSFGSAELDYLAHGSAGTANPDQPFFFAARMKAARGMPATEQVRLLRAALEDTPSGDGARIPLLKAASEVGDYYLAIAVMQPYSTGADLESAIDGMWDSDDEVEETPAPDEQQRVHEPASDFAKLPAKERAAFSRLMGVALFRTKAPDKALSYLLRAYRRETDAGIKAQLNKDIQQIRFTQRRQAANRTRQPQVHSELEQENLVRPRLPERPVSSTPRPQGQGQKGAAQ